MRSYPLNKILTVKLNYITNYKHNVVQQVPRSFSSCVTNFVPVVLFLITILTNFFFPFTT